MFVCNKDIGQIITQLEPSINQNIFLCTCLLLFILIFKYMCVCTNIYYLYYFHYLTIKNYNFKNFTIQANSSGLFSAPYYDPYRFFIFITKSRRKRHVDLALTLSFIIYILQLIKMLSRKFRLFLNEIVVAIGYLLLLFYKYI